MPYQRSDDGLTVMNSAADLTVEPDVNKADAAADFGLFFELTKVDEQKREVWGRATEERPDRVREVMDYKTSAPNFKAWSNETLQRSTGIAGLPESARSLGNVREMHQAIAAGKVIDIQFNDIEKAIDIGTVCTDDDTWGKILNGTLTGFSIGGSANRWADPTNPSYKRYTAYPAEISYVDSPALPTATFKLIKADGSTELRKVGVPADLPVMIGTLPTTADVKVNNDEGSTPEPPVASVQAGQAVTVIPGDPPTPDVIDTSRVMPISAPLAEPVAKTDARALFSEAFGQFVALRKAADEQEHETILKAVGAKVGIARRDGEPKTPPQDYPANADEYGDPANHRWPCDSAARCSSALAYFNGGKGKDTYSDQEWATLGRRIAGFATAKLGVKHTFNPQNTTIETDKQETQKMDMSKLELAPVVAQLQQALGMAADTIGTDPIAAQALLRTLVADLTASTTTAAVNPMTPAPAPTGEQEGLDDMALKGAGIPGATILKPSTFEAMMDTKLATFMDAIGKRLDAIAPAAEPVQKNMPVGDIMTILNARPQEPQSDPVLEALRSGDKYALQKAAEAAGAQGKPDTDTVMQKVNEAVSAMTMPIFTRMMIARGYNHLPAGN